MNSVYELYHTVKSVENTIRACKEVNLLIQTGYEDINNIRQYFDFMREQFNQFQQCASIVCNNLNEYKINNDNQSRLRGSNSNIEQMFRSEKRCKTTKRKHRTFSRIDISDTDECEKRKKKRSQKKCTTDWKKAELCNVSNNTSDAESCNVEDIDRTTDDNNTKRNTYSKPDNDGTRSLSDEENEDTNLSHESESEKENTTSTHDSDDSDRSDEEEETNDGAACELNGTKVVAAENSNGTNDVADCELNGTKIVAVANSNEMNDVTENCDVPNVTETLNMVMETTVTENCYVPNVTETLNMVMETTVTENELNGTKVTDERSHAQIAVDELNIALTKTNALMNVVTEINTNEMMNVTTNCETNVALTDTWNVASAVPWNEQSPTQPEETNVAVDQLLNIYPVTSNLEPLSHEVPTYLLLDDLEEQRCRIAKDQERRLKFAKETEEACLRRANEEEDGQRRALLVEYRSIVDTIQTWVPAIIKKRYANVEFDLVNMKEPVIMILVFDGTVLNIHLRDTDKPKHLKKLEKMFEKCSPFSAVCIYSKRKNEICFFHSTLTPENMSKISPKLKILKRSEGLTNIHLHLPNERSTDFFIWLRDGTLIHVPQTFRAVVGICGIQEGEPHTYILSAMYRNERRICGHLEKTDFTHLDEFITDGTRDDNRILFKHIHTYISIEFSDYDGHYMTNVTKSNCPVKKVTNIESFWKET